ncbi:MAG: transcription-repair coupling factor [Coriobacteriia bacterium]|nr:transcription-repair coupling factor [Coriobacteriia bacterium]
MDLLHAIREHLHAASPYRIAGEGLARGEDVTLAAPGLVRPALVAALWSERPRPSLVVVPGEEASERFARQVAAYIPRDRVLHLPERRETPWSPEPPDIEAVGRRARALHALGGRREVVVVASPRGLMRTVPPRGSHVYEPLTLAAGGTLDLEEAAERLARMGYERLERAEDRGRFAVRGGVLDVFPSEAVAPVRAELFGDEVESLRRYVPSSGQAVADAGPVEVYTCREVALGSRAAQAAERALGDEALRDQGVALALESIKAGVYFNGVEQYLPVLYKQPGAVTDYLPPEALVVVAEPRALFDDSARCHGEITAKAVEDGKPMEGLYLKPSQLDLGGRQRLTFVSLLRAGSGVDAELVARRPEVAGGEDRLVGGLRALLALEYAVVMAVPARETRRRVADVLVGGGISVAETLLDAGAREAPDGLAPGVVHLSRAEVPSGYVVPDARLAVVSVDDVYPRSAEARRARSAGRPISFDFAPGDHVVHSTHGIALLRDVVRKEAGGAVRDYLLLEYAKGDKLYVPTEQLDRVSRYVGADASAPRVTRLDTADWSKATGKARKAVKKLAFDLVDLYARRSSVSGHAFGPDTPWQLEMEAAFPFEETRDQLAAIADVKADMESPAPMDRLVCGDVGYGKTEVAIRAAFKAVQDGKQVMVLCPTTILAQQHYTTFSERYAPFPVRVEVLSRFRTAKEQEESLRGLAAGEVDVLIGTHRLLSRDVTPKDLGLVVIDEEQRFGVEHKEHLKHLREQVDVLTLTATPIPRTLQMALTGVREISSIDTPPPNRFPVKVHVGEYDPEVVSDAIRREVQRGGQVYFVSNRVRTIEEATRRVADAAPEARVRVAHGRMSEQALERVMESFAAGEFDVLVSTTIVESGIDNPHTNTLVIEDSQRLGLAQLYQLKGRVGRSHVRAFAYFLFPRGANLTDEAYERLTAIRDHADMGSGIRLAMRDLQIRGAGSLLGAEQHGNMSAVGFELYSQMLREAVAEARGEPLPEPLDVRVDLPVAAFLPEEYVPDTGERVRLYRRIAAAGTPEAVERLSAELTETFGPPPEAARNLLGVARLKTAVAEAGGSALTMSRSRVAVHPVSPGPEARGSLAKAGGLYLERDRKAVLPAAPGQAPIEAAAVLLDAILARAVPARAGGRTGTRRQEERQA